MWVTNNSEQDLEDGYDGIRYKFVSGQSIEVPLVVVQHVFGLGQDDKKPFLMRLGWIQKPGDYERALARLNLFSFSSEKPQAKVHVLSPVVESSPIPIPKKRGWGTVLKSA